MGENYLNFKTKANKKMDLVIIRVGVPGGTIFKKA